VPSAWSFGHPFIMAGITTTDPTATWLLLLADREVRVMVWPNPERVAWERQQVWQSQCLQGPLRPVSRTTRAQNQLRSPEFPGKTAGHTRSHPVVTPPGVGHVIELRPPDQRVHRSSLIISACLTL
jgi:hypothetical protein